MFRRGTFHERRYHPYCSSLETRYYVNSLLIKLEHFRYYIICQSLGWWQDLRTKWTCSKNVLASGIASRTMVLERRETRRSRGAIYTRVSERPWTRSYVKRCDWQAHFWNRREPGPRILIWIINWSTTLATNLIYIDFHLGIDLIKWKVYFYDEKMYFIH